ncbi:cytochrome c oxidase subunit II [Mongoliimonas terrestris]|uniref:cytochrome c oxidase subunit II n=1 Tax=Mongoliimonas terrestris TaxID=1709001 RepID=UPI0009498FF9|nr:cytochrome c oxidase subunit II [Mongoliimonas terrestris]
MKRLLACVAGVGTLGMSAAHAAQPVEWGTYLQPAASPIMADIHSFGSFTFWIIVPVTLLVLVLLVAVIVKFNAKANPVPSRTSHNTMIEVIWTVAPVLILLMLAVPSFRLLYEEQTIPPADVTIKAIGNKWYWSYEYPDAEAVSFDSTLIEDADITDPVNQPRMLAVDYPIVVPAGKVVRVQVTASDVIHAFAMPSMGVKIDAIPGRLNETWFRADTPGVYYGQCSELCGLRHAYMPIQLNVVTEDQYAQWLAAAAEDMDAATQLLASFRTDATKVAAR